MSIYTYNTHGWNTLLFTNVNKIAHLHQECNLNKMIMKLNIKII